MLDFKDHTTTQAMPIWVIYSANQNHDDIQGELMPRTMSGFMIQSQCGSVWISMVRIATKCHADVRVMSHHLEPS